MPQIFELEGQVFCVKSLAQYSSLGHRDLCTKLSNHISTGWLTLCHVKGWLLQHVLKKINMVNRALSTCLPPNTMSLTFELEFQAYANIEVLVSHGMQYIMISPNYLLSIYKKKIQHLISCPRSKVGIRPSPLQYPSSH